MLKRKLYRLSLALSLAATVSVTGAVQAEDPDPNACASACMVLTNTSGYVGEDAVWYFAGCYLGCTMRKLF